MPSAESEVAPSSKTATTFKTAGYAAHSTTGPLTPFSFERREPGPNDLQIENPRVRRLSLGPGKLARGRRWESSDSAVSATWD